MGGLFKERRFAPPPRISWEDTETWESEGVHWRRHGFICLDLEGPVFREAYIDQCGCERWTDKLTASS